MWCVYTNNAILEVTNVYNYKVHNKNEFRYGALVRFAGKELHRRIECRRKE